MKTAGHWANPAIVMVRATAEPRIVRTEADRLNRFWKHRRSASGDSTLAQASDS
jgi:hypothetical protein